MATRLRSVRIYQRPSTSAGDASVASPIRLTWSTSNFGPARSTNVSPSSLVKNTLPSMATGEAAHDDLVAIPDGNRDRRPPPHACVTSGPPDWRSRAGVERAHEGVGGILIEDDPVAVQQRRPCLAVVRIHRAEISIPDQRAVQIEGEQSAAAERDVEALAVCCGRRRGVTVLEVRRPHKAQRDQYRAPSPSTGIRRTSEAWVTTAAPGLPAPP